MKCGDIVARDGWVALRSGCEVYNGVNLCVRHNPIKMGLINTQERSSGMATQWEQLISSTMTPTTAVAVKLAVTPEEEEGGPVGVVGEVEGGHGVGGGVGTRRRTGLLARIARHWPSLAKIRRAANSEQGSPLFRRARFSSRRVRRRVVFKQGDCNVVQGRVAKRRRKYLQDIFTTLVDAQWRWTLLVFALNFLLSWLGFAAIWWLIVYTHGDLDPTVADNSTWVPCVRDVKSFTSCFLFSVETQHTIGYGAKHTTEECPEAIFVMCLQSIAGVMIQAFMVGIVFAKLSRPKKRTQTLLFSRNAVICQRDGQLCLMFRVGDMRKSHIIEAHVRAQLISKKVTREGEVLPFYQQELRVGGDGEEDRIFFIWPTTIVHKITPESPLYTFSAADMLRHRFEIVVILEGVIESTGMTTQARSSYLPSEILWGHRFEPLVSFKKETGEHEVDYSLFNNTYEVDTPLCSAQSLDQLIGLNSSNSNGLKYPVGGSSTSATPDLTSMESNSMLCDKENSMQHIILHPTDIPGPESRI